jgi:outer membrane beta-barrel protein
MMSLEPNFIKEQFMRHWLVIGFLILSFGWSPKVFSQEGGDSAATAPSADEASTSSAQGTADDVDTAIEQSLLKDDNIKDEETPEVKPVPQNQPTDLSGLAQLAPFSDIAVIQKKYLPKSHRFEFFPGLGLVMNDAFFNNLSLNMRLAYFFTEQYGVEAAVHLIGTSEKTVTKDLANKGVVTRSLVSPQGYFGGAFRWSPFYGKMGYVDNIIIPYELYFLAGGGSTQTNKGINAGTLTVGTGQIFAVKKWMAARWELSWYMYSVNGTNVTNLYATLGVSFFFPGAKYR